MHSSLDASACGCCAFPRCRSSLRYRSLPPAGETEPPVRVVVGKERRVFFVDPFVLELDPLRILMETPGCGLLRRKDTVFIDVDAILFEHMLWLVFNERPSSSASFFELNLKEIIEFYSQDN